ncbi:hypothetical protein HBH49_072450 [Parastagonospora nodorum]|nr:hypothetical protein HBH49_072450 [Parastagonospora nodorum]
MLFLISCATEKVHVCAVDSLSSTVIVYDYIEKDKNADLVIADSILDALDMCAKDDLIYDGRLAGELATAESVTAKDSNHVDTFGLDFAFSFAAWLQRIKCTLGDINSLFADNILSLIAFIISYCLFADKLWWNIQQSLLDGATVVLIIILASFCYVSSSTTILAYTVEHCCLLSNTALENAAKSGILLACVDRRTRQCYLTICAILRCLDKGHDDFVHLVNCFGWKHYNFNIHVSLATDILYLLLKGLVMKMLDFMQDMLDDIYPSKQKAIIQQLIAVVSLLFVSKAPFALYFICVVCDLHALIYIIQDIRMYGALDSICTGANSEVHYITIVKQFYSMINKKDSSVSCISVQIHSSIKCWRFSGKRHNDPEHCDEEVLYLILIIIDYTCYDKDGKYMAYIGAFFEVLLFNNNGQIDNTTRMLTFKFYDLSTIICSVHLVPRDLPDLITRTTMSYYVNNYIDWDEYNRLYLLIFDIDLLRTL